MFGSLINGLKKIKPLVTLVRVVNGIGDLWRKVGLELQQQSAHEHALNFRKGVIATYLGSDAIHKLQIGAGTNPLSGWLNTDFEPIASEIIFLDATERFPFDDQIFDYVFSEHMIEHIPYKDGLYMLREAFRVLKHGGRIRLATPDLEKIVSLLSPDKTEQEMRYLQWSAQENLGLYTPVKSRLQIHRPEWDLDHEHISRAFPDPGKDSACFVVNNFFHSYGHRFLYDAFTLQAVMQDVGFVEVKLCLPGESEDDHLRGIENHQRLIGNEMNDFESMVLEARRP